MYRPRGVLLVLGLCGMPLGCRDDQSGPPDRPNIILITFESLRADHVGCYGYERATTPTLDALSREAILFPNAYSVTSWTLTSHASIFTGLYPRAHQVIRPRDRLASVYVTAAEVLQDAGYQTAGLISGPYLRQAYNLHQGFEIYDDSASSVTNNVAHDDIANPTLERRVTKFLTEQRSSDRPFFLFLYIWDPHYDYIPPPPFDTMFTPPDAERVNVRNYEIVSDVHRGITAGQLAYVLSQYDGEIRCTDAMLGRLFAQLREQGLWDRTALIVTADHGEEFFEHGNKGHKNNLHVESLHVPLLVKPPKPTAPRRDDRLVSLIDVFPTVLEWANATVDHEVHGRSLLRPTPNAARPLYFELTSTRYSLDWTGRIVG